MFWVSATLIFALHSRAKASVEWEWTKIVGKLEDDHVLIWGFPKMGVPLVIIHF